MRVSPRCTARVLSCKCKPLSGLTSASVCNLQLLKLHDLHAYLLNFKTAKLERSANRATIAPGTRSPDFGISERAIIHKLRPAAAAPLIAAKIIPLNPKSVTHGHYTSEWCWRIENNKFAIISSYTASNPSAFPATQLRCCLRLRMSVRSCRLAGDYWRRSMWLLCACKWASSHGTTSITLQRQACTAVVPLTTPLASRTTCDTSIEGIHRCSTL